MNVSFGRPIRWAFGWLLVAGLAGATLAGIAHAQDAGGTGTAAPAVAADDGTAPDLPSRVKVGLYVNPPFVIKGDDGYSGMAFDLWEAVSGDLGVESDYVELPTIRALVDATADGKVDVAVSNLTITKRRAERFDFTYPWFDAGFRIMINENAGRGFWATMRGLYESGYLKSYAWIAFVILVATVLLTIFDRRFDKSFPSRWRDGVAESFYTVMSVATTGRMSRKNLFGWVGRIWQGIWLICGVAVLAYVTSTVTSVMTTIALTSQIRNASDLDGRVIGVRTGGTAEEYAEANGLAYRSYANIDGAVRGLLRGRVDAIVGDAPVLEYYAFSHPEDPVRVVGPIFQPEKYGFGVSNASNLVRPATLELLDAFEKSQIEVIREKYFGERPG